MKAFLWSTAAVVAGLAAWNVGKMAYVAITTPKKAV